MTAIPPSPSTSSLHSSHQSKAVARAEARMGVTTEFKDLQLHSACANGNLGLVKYALMNGQPVNSVLNGLLPIHAASSSGNEAIVKMLIEHGADVNSPRLPRKYTSDKSRSAPPVGTSGLTPLHFAAANGHTAIISLLLSYGARASATEKYGHTPESLARQSGYEASAEMLRSWREAEEFEDEASSSHGAAPSLHDRVKRKLHPKRSMDNLALGLSQASLSLHQHSHHHHHHPQEGGGKASALERKISKTSSGSGRHLSTGTKIRNALRKGSDPPALRTSESRTSLSSSLWSKGDQSPTLPSSAETTEDDIAAVSASLVRNASDPSIRRRSEDFFRVRSGSFNSARPALLADDSPSTAPSSKTSFAPSDLSLPPLQPHHHPSTRSYSSGGGTSNPSFYRPRQSSQLSVTSRVLPSPLATESTPASPHPFEDDDDGEPPNPEPSGADGDGTLKARTFAVDVRRAALGRDRAESLGANSSPRLVVPAGPSATKQAETRSSRSNSAGTDGRFSSSSFTSSYSGRGTLSNFSTYAPSSSTVSSSVVVASASNSAKAPSTVPQHVTRQPFLSPLYENKSSQEAGHHVTTSAQARHRIKKAERDLLAFHPSTTSGADSNSMQPTLSERLAAYGQSLSLEKRLKASEEAQQSAGQYHWETIGKDGKHIPTPTAASAATLEKPTSKPAAETTPHWRAIPSQDRLMPPSSPLVRRSASPTGSSPVNTAVVSTSPSFASTRRYEPNHGLAPAATITRASSPSSASGSISYEVVPAPSSTSGARGHSKHRGSGGGAAKSVRTHSDKGGSVTSGRDQVLLDAAEQARIAASVPQAQITVPKKKGGFFRFAK